MIHYLCAVGNYRHFLENSLTGAPAAGSNLTFAPSGGNIITNYATPGPLGKFS